MYYQNGSGMEHAGRSLAAPEKGTAVLGLGLILCACSCTVTGSVYLLSYIEAL